MSADGSVPASALELHGLSKRFGDVIALDTVSFTVRAGSVHALLGENGAGKTTLMRIAAGFLAPDVGDVRLFGVAMRGHTARDAVRAGVGMVHQHMSLVPALTTTENLVLGGRGLFRSDSADEMLRSVATASGLRVPPGVIVGHLSVVEQQRLEILKTLARDARLLILDEPTAVLAPAEAEELMRWIRSYAESGGSVVLVTHKLREAIGVADEVTVLRRGQVVHAGPTRSVSEGELTRAIFHDLEMHADRVEAVPSGDPIVDVKALAMADARGIRRIRGATFLVRRHEIVGIAAVEGSGHRELLGALAARTVPAAGSVRLPARIALIPADRARDALIPDFTLVENVALRELGDRRGLIPWSAIAADTVALLRRFSIAAASPWVRARALSGGNQQRLVVARELAEEVDLVVADNPTRGLDMRATQFVHDQLRAAAARGAAVVLHSSDLDEILALATRVLVVFHGDVREVKRERGEVSRAMLGAA